jgi:CRP-like cAMP-binding protein
MPKSFQFKTGSLIYYMGEDADKVYILHSGKVSLAYLDIESGKDVRSPVQPGEFFGVKSALGRFPREENAVAVSDSTVMAFTVPEFEAMATSNTRIILKMLKVFSNQMRRLHAQVASLLAKEEANPEEGLFAIGEKYLKSKRYDHAKYIFDRYLVYYPEGKYADKAVKNLKLAENTFSRNTEKKSTQDPVYKEAPLPPKDSGASKAYYDAVNFISQKKYNEAIDAFNKIIVANEEPEWTEKSSYEAGHCLFLLGKFQECVNYFKKFLTLYPDYPDLRDVMYYIGQSYEKISDEGQAKIWYKKIIQASGAEKDSARTKAVKALNNLEGR